MTALSAKFCLIFWRHNFPFISGDEMSLHASVRCWPLPVNGDHQDFILKVRDFFSSIFMQATIASWGRSDPGWIPGHAFLFAKNTGQQTTNFTSFLHIPKVSTLHGDGCPRSGEKVSILEQRREKSRCLGPTPWILEDANCELYQKVLVPTEGERFGGWGDLKSRTIIGRDWELLSVSKLMLAWIDFRCWKGQLRDFLQVVVVNESEWVKFLKHLCQKNMWLVPKNACENSWFSSSQQPRVLPATNCWLVEVVASQIFVSWETPPQCQPASPSHLASGAFVAFPIWPRLSEEWQLIQDGFFFWEREMTYRDHEKLPIFWGGLNNAIV